MIVDKTKRLMYTMKYKPNGLTRTEVSKVSKSIVVDRVKVIAQMARLDITGEELAQKAGVGRSSIIKMRKGQAVWRTTAQHVARALGVDVADLLESKGE